MYFLRLFCAALLILQYNLLCANVGIFLSLGVVLIDYCRSSLTLGGLLLGVASSILHLLYILAQNPNV